MSRVSAAERELEFQEADGKARLVRASRGEEGSRWLLFVRLP